MKNKNLTNRNSTVKVAVVCAVIGWICWSAANFCQAQTPPANPSGLSPDLQEVVKLSQSHMGNDVIVNYIKNSGKSYSLSADDLVYLSSQGVSQGVISALQTASSANPNPPVTVHPPTTPPLNQGLIAYYPFNGNANDASGNGRNGALYNSPAFITSPFGSAIHLIGQGRFGTGGQYVTIPSIDLSSMSAFTISLWANVEGITSPGDGEYILEIGNDCPDNTHVVGIEYSFNSAGTYNLGFQAGNVGIGPATSYSIQWHRYSMVYANGVITAYIDGHVVGTTNCSIASTAGDAGMGIHWWCNNPYGVSTRFTGSLADIRIYNRALSDAEIQELAGVSSNPSVPPPQITPDDTTNSTAEMPVSLLPANWISFDAIDEIGNTIYVGGSGVNGATFGRCDVTTRTFTDLSNLLPSSWSRIASLAYGDNQLVIGGDQPRLGHIGVFIPTANSFQDLTAQLLNARFGRVYDYGLGPIVFNDNEFLIGGAGSYQSLELYSQASFTSLSQSFHSYFAVNTITPYGDSFLIAGAGAGPGPAQPPKMGWISENGSFTDQTGSLPPDWGTTWHSAYDGNDFLLQGVDHISGKQELFALFNPSRGASVEVTDSFPTSFTLHSVDGGNGFFLLGGQLNGNANLSLYSPGAPLKDLTSQLPTGASDVTVVKISSSGCIVGGVVQGGQNFLTIIPNVAAIQPEETNSPQAQEVNFDYFHDQLAPFGTWVEVPGYGQCWSPSQAIAANPDWRPYYDFGQWVYTDNGWFWQSDYTWGDIPFHYGNWIRDPGYGWLWVPSYTWGPSWVFWRQAEADGCIGWAPLPPGAVFVDGGWMFHGARVGVDFDFGLGADFFVFVGYDHFHDGFFRMRGHEYGFNVPRERVRAFYGRTVLRNEFRRDEHGRLVNDGIGRDRIEHLTNHKEEVAHFEERTPVGDRDRLAAQRAEEVRRQVGPQAGKPGEPGHEQSGKPGGQPLAAPAPVNKVFRPPTPASNPATVPSQRQAQAPQQKQSQKKQ